MSSSPLKKGTGSDRAGGIVGTNGGREAPVPLFQRAASASSNESLPFVACGFAGVADSRRLSGHRTEPANRIGVRL
jgi:hypothetical protein